MMPSEAASPSIPPELIDALASNQLVICVGPRLGHDAGTADLGALTQTLLRAAERAGVELDWEVLQHWASNRRELECLELLERHLGARFGRIVEATLAGREQSIPPLARAIAALSDPLRAVYTTGIDRLLERAFADAWPSFSFARPDLARRSNLIFKLCGTLEFRDSWVLTRATFEREFGQRGGRRELLVTAARAHCLLFVGFDPRADLDARILALLDAHAEAIQLPGHFIALEHCDPEQRALLERRGLQVLDTSALALLGALAPTPSSLEPASKAATASVQLPVCPYPGLASFGPTMSAVFHGRRAEISQAAARLGGPVGRHRRWLAIEGSSGVGKSSFVHAGLIPALHQGFAESTPLAWRVLCLRPGVHPFRALAQALATTLRPPRSRSREQAIERLGARMHAEQDAVANLVEFVRELAPLGEGLLLVIDQLEELVTLSTVTERESFGACLNLLLERRLIYLVTTMRADFSAALPRATPTLARLLNQDAARYTLAPISRVGLRAAISEPAAQLGVHFETGLVERIASDAEQHLSGPRGRETNDMVARTDDAALPLVAHVLRGLWDARAADDGEVRFSEYRSLGGVEGALSRSADTLLASFSSRERACVRALLLRLVNLDDEQISRRSMSRGQALRIVGRGEAGQRLLAALAGSLGPRLVVIRGEGDNAVIDLIHEALLREWDTLRSWITADRAQLALDDALARRTSAWRARGRPWRSLPRGPERKELLRGRPHGEYEREQGHYQRAMRSAVWLRVGGWLGFAASLAVISMLVISKMNDVTGSLNDVTGSLNDERNQRDQSERKLAQTQSTHKREQQHAQLLDSVRADFDTGQCHGALIRLLDKAELRSDPTLGALLERAVRCELVVGPQRLLARGDGTPIVFGLNVDPDAKKADIWLGRSSGQVERLSLQNGRSTFSAELPRAATSIRVAPGGERVALVSSGRTHLWSRDGTFQESYGGSQPFFSADGRHLVIRLTENMRIMIRDAHDGELLWEPPEDKVRGLALDSRRVALANGARDRADNYIVVYQLDRPEELARLFVEDYVYQVAFSASDPNFIAGADARAIRSWDLREPEATPLSFIHELSEPSKATVQSSPSGDQLLISSHDSRVSLATLDLDIAPKDAPRFANESFDTPPRFSPDSRWFAVANEADRLHLWSTRSRESVAQVKLGEPLDDLHFSTDALLASDTNGNLVELPLDDRDHWQMTLDGPGSIQALSFASDTHVEAIDSNGAVSVWSIPQAKVELDPQPLRESFGSPGSILSMASSQTGGRHVVSNDGRLYTWLANGSIGETTLGCPLEHAVFVANALGLVCTDGAVLWWELASGRARVGPQSRALASIAATPPTPTSLGFDASGDWLVSGSNENTLTLWDLANPELKFVEQSTPTGYNIEATAVSPDGEWIAAGFEKHGQVSIWARAAFGGGPSIDRHPCPGHHVTALAFSPGADLLAASCADGSLHAWPLSVDAQIDLACTRLEQVRAPDALPPATCVSP